MIRPPEVNAPQRSATAAFLICGVLAAHGLLAWQLRARGVFTFGDDAAYMLLARALRAFSYRELYFVGEPVAARFPPGYPAALAVSSALFGERLSVIGLLGIVFSMSGIWALYDVVRRRWNTNAGLVAATLAATNPAVLAFVAIPASETMYTTFTLWTLWTADRLVNTAHEPARSRSTRRYVALAIAVAIIAAMTRSVGVTLLIALIVHWAWQRRFRAALVALAAASIIVGGWLAWTTLAPRREVRLSYIDDAIKPVDANAPSIPRIFARRLAANVPVYTTQASLALLSVPVTPRSKLDNVAWATLLGSLLLVGWVSAWKRWNAAALYVLGYSGLLAIWPYVLERFVVPLVPLVLALIAIGAVRVGELWRRRPDAALALVALALCIFALRADATLVGAAADCDRSRAECAPAISLDFVAAARLAATATPATARFVTPKGATLYYHGGRQAVFWEEAVVQDSASFLPYLRRRGVTHVLSTPVYGDYETILRLIQPHCSRFALVHAFSPHTLILAFLDSAASVSDGTRACAYVRRALESTQRWDSGIPRPLVQRAPSELREADRRAGSLAGASPPGAPARRRLTPAGRANAGGQAVRAADEI
jgi:hypothetical protein